MSRTRKPILDLESLAPQWRELLRPESEKEYFQELSRFLEREYNDSGHEIYPKSEDLLRALKSVDYCDVKVVILGQDPYHGAKQATGLAFAVPNSLRLKPPSLQNVFKEVSANFGVEMKDRGSDLTGWAEQGVLLLNTVLSVRASEAFSHRKRGWEEFTDRILELLNQRKDGVIFMLWGSPARSKKSFITQKQHTVLEASHPSPLSASRGFMGCAHFLKANEVLRSQGKRPIDWSKSSSS
jgi:uracil-DNA glycosylase